MHNVVGLPGQLHPGYPATPEGQGRFLADLARTVRRTPGGRGVFYWAPEDVTAPRRPSALENLALFDTGGTLLAGADSLVSASREERRSGQ
jgi:arabinogalactan endo-1,4-beta-galactosidase